MLARLGNQGRAALLDTYNLYLEGHITRDVFNDVSANVLQHINERGATYGRLSYESLASTLTGRDFNPTAAAAATPAPSTTEARLARGLDTILDGDPDQIEMRLDRLGHTAPIEQVQLGYDSGLQADPLVEGWTRGLNDSACQLCQWWWRDGRVWEKEHPLQTHKGCLCQKVPVWVEHIQETWNARYDRIAREAKENYARQRAARQERVRP